MKTSLLTACALAGATALSAQTTILDFETAATSANYQYFGNGDLTETIAAIIDNPDKDNDVNSSDKVLEFKERAAGMGVETFAGAFPNPTHERAVDLTVATEVCMDVWMPVISDVAVKLEEGTAGNWVRAVANTKTNEWEQLCWNTALPGLEDAQNPAAGNTYNKVVIFAGFQAVPDTDLTYYFDNLIVREGETSNVDVTFSVDLTDFDGDISSVGVAGNFNDFTAANSPLTDDNSDGIYEGTFSLETGGLEYLFVVNDEFESLAPGSECVKVTLGGNGEVFVNRAATLAEETTFSTVAYGSCYARGAGVDITFNVGTTNIDVADEGLYIAGGAAFGAPGQIGYRLLDDDGDGVYSLTIERAAGFGSYFTITNGACADYSCKENLDGFPCGDPNNFNDRLLPAVTQDTMVNVNFGDCASPPVNVRDLAAIGVDFSVQPTVATDAITLEFGRSLEEATVRVFDVTGKALHTIALSGVSRHTLDVSELTSGYYMVQLDYAGARGVQRIVKQ